MSVQTYPVTWPTEESFKPLDEALATAFNELEGKVLNLRLLVDGPTTFEALDRLWPDPRPTFETVGVLWNALGNLRVDIDQLTSEAEKLEHLIRGVNEIRRDGPLQGGDDAS